MARLRRCAHRLVWLNPLAAAPALRAAHARDAGRGAVRRTTSSPGNSIASLEELAGLMEEACG